MDLTLQSNLIETVKMIAGERIGRVNFTKSFTGHIKSVNGLRCVVEIDGSNSECIIPHNLIPFIEVDDIVIIQDINNRNSKKIVQGVISSTRKNMFHIYDPTTDSIISSVLDLWDEDLQETVNVIFEIE